MPLLRTLSVSAQAAAHIRAEVERGRWNGSIPGVYRLAIELGVNRKTVEAALRQLEHEGLLIGQGKGRKRLIVRQGGKPTRPMKIAVLLYEPVDRQLEYIVELQHALADDGHSVIVASKSLTELKMDVKRVSQLVKQTAADAWIILAGSREVLQWFCEQPKPAFALFGRWEGLPIAAAGPDKVPAFVEATNRLVGLGHRRVVLIARRVRRLPELGRSERSFLDTLIANGLKGSDFNLPDWEETPEGVQELLSSLFRVTPPTAMIVEEAPFFAAVLQFLAGRGVRVPQQVSVICTDADPTFTWCTPSISHIRWDSAPLVRRIVRWAARVGKGRKDVKQTGVPAEFIVGGTIGPVPTGEGS